MLRARASRREDPEGLQSPDIGQTPDVAIDPEQEAALAESVGRALLVVLNRLAPVERIAFVLHDMFAVPFDEIAPIVARSTIATKKLASRARRKVRGTPAIHGTELARHRRVVERFLAASRAGDIAAILIAARARRRETRRCHGSGAGAAARGTRRPHGRGGNYRLRTARALCSGGARQRRRGSRPRAARPPTQRPDHNRGRHHQQL
jgi:RNA polymerase sigma-70 factor (ECF subfamily)